MRVIIRTIVGLCLIAAVTAHAFNGSGKLPTVGKPAPDFELTTHVMRGPMFTAEWRYAPADSMGKMFLNILVTAAATAR